MYAELGKILGAERRLPPTAMLWENKDMLVWGVSRDGRRKIIHRAKSVPRIERLEFRRTELLLAVELPLVLVRMEQNLIGTSIPFLTWTQGASGNCKRTW